MNIIKHYVTCSAQFSFMSSNIVWKNPTFWALLSITAHLGRYIDTVAIFQGVLTCVWWDYIINFTSACHCNNNIIKFTVIIAAGSSLISGQKGWSPFSCRIIAKPLTWTWINKPAGFPLHCEWALPLNTH